MSEHTGSEKKLNPSGHGAGKKRRNITSLKKQIMKDLGDIPEEDVKHMCGMDPTKDIGDCIMINPFPERNMPLYKGASNSNSAVHQNADYWGKKNPYIIAAVLGTTTYGAISIGIELRYTNNELPEPMSVQISNGLFSGSPLRFVLGVAESTWDDTRFKEHQQSQLLDDSEWSGKIELAMFGSDALMLMGYTTAKCIFSEIIMILVKRIKSGKGARKCKEDGKEKEKEKDDTTAIKRATPYDSTGEPVTCMSVVICGHPLYETRYVMAMHKKKSTEDGSTVVGDNTPNTFAVSGSFPFVAALSCVMSPPPPPPPTEEKKTSPVTVTASESASATAADSAPPVASTSVSVPETAKKEEVPVKQTVVEKSAPVFECEYNFAVKILEKISHVEKTKTIEESNVAHEQPSCSSVPPPPPTPSTS